MRRDSIFYALFQQSPALLFELLDTPPANAQNYRFDCVAVKEPKFEIDGVFLPPEGDSPGVVYFCEVQFQKDPQLYERLFGEAFLYFYRNRDRFSDWQAVVIYPSRSLEQNRTHPYQDLLNGERVHRVYLKVSTIMVYKFTSLSRQEIEAMLGTKLEETRVYQEAYQEGQEEKAQAIALNLLREKIPLETIARTTGLTIAQLQQLQAENPRRSPFTVVRSLPAFAARWAIACCSVCHQ
jgi:predicted transposase YdaD